MSYSISQIKDMAWLFDVTVEWAAGRRLLYLNGFVAYYRGHQGKMAQFMSGANAETRAFIASSIKDSQNCIKKLQRQVTALTTVQKSRTGQITDEMIERAKESPLDELIEVHRGKALCPFHDDHHPSMSIHNNRFNCFACGVRGDTIEFLMKRDGLSFQDAVSTLAGV